MTETEQKEVKVLIEKVASESAKIVAQLETKVAGLEADVERKNKALEGYIAENEALKQEMSGSKPRAVTGSPASAYKNDKDNRSPSGAAAGSGLMQVSLIGLLFMLAAMLYGAYAAKTAPTKARPARTTASEVPKKTAKRPMAASHR